MPIYVRRRRRRPIAWCRHPPPVGTIAGTCLPLPTAEARWLAGKVDLSGRLRWPTRMYSRWPAEHRWKAPKADKLCALPSYPGHNRGASQAAAAISTCMAVGYDLSGATRLSSRTMEAWRHGRPGFRVPQSALRGRGRQSFSAPQVHWFPPMPIHVPCFVEGRTRQEPHLAPSIHLFYKNLPSLFIAHPMLRCLLSCCRYSAWSPNFRFSL